MDLLDSSDLTPLAGWLFNLLGWVRAERRALQGGTPMTYCLQPS